MVPNLLDTAPTIYMVPQPPVGIEEVVAKEEIQYQVDVVKDEPDRLGTVNIFTSLFRRRSSTERPRSALPFLQQSVRPSSSLRNDTFNIKRKWSADAKNVDILDLLRRSSNTASVGNQFTDSTLKYPVMHWMD
uniref:Uncharacterized protein n=1 Tax=Ditylenchus dipsaci TaxID=166011 RepID=A0A915CSB0_9BILA